ncbi:hypothetical protein JAAARDRAFT_72089 [Jaapia argillacea MUCL 33604]|uniref:Uncharacterized protein n=1 Tax=Jaapia argillacea MUCL 33604 TaxID=933084 RepID=A0A067PSX8_9AGAM|nr:hypothetical protein JAAARDRAFT_72089 [Jaapia argillacea MUCL 33604]
MVLLCGGYILTNDQVRHYAKKLGIRMPTKESLPSIVVNAHYMGRGLSQPFIGVEFEGEFWNIWVTQQKDDGKWRVDPNYEKFEEREYDRGLKRKFERIGIVDVRYVTVADPFYLAPEEE